MIFYAHRGNMHGPNPKDENNPKYLKAAIDAGFEVEVDLWYKDGHFWFGHDRPEYKVKYSWMAANIYSCIFHCKNIGALAQLRESEFSRFHYFWHQEDEYTLTSEGLIWVYPGRPFPTTRHYIACQPGLIDMPWAWNEIGGICSDHVHVLRLKKEALDV